MLVIRTGVPQNSKGMRTLERAQDEIAKGRLWRAKDILAGGIGSHPYEASLYLAYGELLLQMGDLRQAGRFLFLSGSKKTEHHQAIDLFLSQFKSGHKNELYAAFPARARLSKLSDYPQRVADELRKKGFEEIIKHPAAPPIPKTIWGRISKGCAFAFFSILLMLLVFGVLKAIYLGMDLVFGWIVRLFFS